MFRVAIICSAFAIITLLLFLGVDCLHARVTPGLFRRQVTLHSRLGPALFVILAAITSFLAYWFPLWRDRQYPADIDTRIGFLIVGFAPLTTGTAILAVYSYFRLYRLQRQSPTAIGRILLVVLALPLTASAYTGGKLIPEAFLFLPSFIISLFILPFKWIWG